MSRNGRDSQRPATRCKKFAGEIVTGGSILVRQRGTPIQAGRNVSRGKDDTLFATASGRVEYRDRGQRGRFVSVDPVE